MNNYFKRPFLTLVLALSALYSFGQTSTPEKSSSLKFGVNYINNSVFMGRADTVHTSIIMPNIKYTFKWGGYLMGNIDYVPNTKTQKLAGGGIGLGYAYDITSDLSMDVSYTKLFYNSSSTQVASSQSGQLSAMLNYDISDIVTTIVNADYAFNKHGFSNDFFLGGGLSHSFGLDGLLTDEDELVIAPTALLNVGTQNFYDSYLVRRKTKGAAKTAAETQLLNQQKNDLSKFKLLDLEFSVPLEYKINHFIFSFTPTYAIAQNTLPASISSGLVAKSGQFYFETGLTIKF